jgi:hypothetical protein
MGGPGGGGPGGPRGRANQNKQPTPEQKAEQAQEKADQMRDDGFAALKAFDTASALEDFSDVLQLEPDDALAHIGLGLARVQKGKLAASETEFTSAIADAKKARDNPPKPIAAAQPGGNKFFANQQPDPDPPKPVDPKVEADANIRLATFNLAVAYSRGNEKPRAMVMIDRLMTEKKPADEMMVNALRSLIAMLDDKAQSTIGALPAMLKDLERENNSVRLVHTPLRRWGVAWMDSDAVTRHRTSRETEPLPQKLPFLLPDDAVLPEGKKPDAPLVNPLLPVVMADGQSASPGDSLANTGTTPGAPAAPTTAPATAPATGGVTSAPVASAPASQAGPAGSTGSQQAGSPSAVSGQVPAAATVERTVNGAAFAVSPDMLLTVARLAVGAKALNVQTVDGTNFTATLVASDDATGMALIKVDGGHFPVLPLASAARPGPVSVAAFTRPGVFGPEMQVLAGEMTFIPGLWSLRVSTHPRSPGSPLLNGKGEVVAILTATRDDALAKLPVMTIDAVRKFVDGKIPPAPAGAAPNPQQAVLELSATREE